MGFYVHTVNIVGSTAPIMEDAGGVMSVVLTPNDAVDVEVTLASTSSGACGPFRAVPVTPMCGEFIIPPMPPLKPRQRRYMDWIESITGRSAIARMSSLQ